MTKTEQLLQTAFGISKDVMGLVSSTEKELSQQFEDIESITQFNQYKVIKAMQSNRLSDTHFLATTGYGYDDIGRDTLEKIYADVFKTESALVRPQMISGTHAISTCLFGNLRPGDELISPVGKPYDTLESVIGIKKANGSLKDYGVIYKQAEFLDDYKFDYEGIKNLITPKTKMVTIQRSKGYSWRKSLTVKEINELMHFIKGIRSDIICMVDNCYGEFVDTEEPQADIIAGSLIKNPGGGLAPVGGYIAGKTEYVDNAAVRLTAPGLGKDVGPSLGLNAPFLQGLFFAPQVVGGCVKNAILVSKVYEQLGFKVMPTYSEQRSDIVQAIELLTRENVISFCEGIQMGAPVDSYVTPEPHSMPGYTSDVIMAAGAFVQGSSIELSADAPMREPYIVYLQGGLTYHHAKLGTMIALQHMKDKNQINL